VQRCSFYETTVPQGDYTFCCSTCWGSGLFLTSVADALEEGDACESLNANDYSSWSVMANNGWSHDTSGDAHLSDMSHDGVANNCQEGSNWFGWSHNAEVGRLSYVMPAAGTGTVDFGNCWSDPGDVVLYVDDVEVARAGPNQQHVIATIVFQAGSTLAIQDEGQNSVAKLTSMDLTCTGDGATCPETTTITVVGSTETEMDANGDCCCCGQPQWFELAELKLFDVFGNNVADQADQVDLLLQPTNPQDVAKITNGLVWPQDQFVVWQNNHNFQGQALVRLTFNTPKVIVGAEMYSTNYESFGTNAQVFAGSNSLPLRIVYAAHNQQGAAHAACYMNGQEFETPCSSEDDAANTVGSEDNCGMNDAVVSGFGHTTFLYQDWYLVRRDHSIDGGWHPVNDDLTGTAPAYGTFSTDPLVQETFSVPFGTAYTELLLASGDMSMWVTITKDELAGQCGSCANCIMELTGSSGLDEPRQYCRAGSGEDPWISAGNHPDLIVYGEMSWSSHHVGQDGSEDALQRGGSNVWVNALPAAQDPCDGINAPGGDTICDSITGSWHNTVDSTGYDGGAICFIGAATGGDNCNNYCAALGRPCMQAQDNVGACGIGGDHTRQDTDQNGCLQNWGGQICGCGLEGDAPPWATSVDWPVTHTDSRVIDPQENRDISPWEFRSGEFSLEECKAHCIENPDTCTGVEFEVEDGTSDCILLRGAARTTYDEPGWTIYALPGGPADTGR
jgi:hypothetical protein